MGKPLNRSFAAQAVLPLSVHALGRLPTFGTNLYASRRTIRAPITYPEPDMTRKKSTPITQDAIARIMRAESAKHGGKIPKGSHVGRLQRRFARQAANAKTPS